MLSSALAKFLKLEANVRGLCVRCLCALARVSESNDAKPVLCPVFFIEQFKPIKMSFIYCQRKEELQSKCKNQCGHCKEYYAPMERIHKLRNELKKVEKQLDKCRTSAIQDGWQTSKHAKKSRKWDYYAQEKMRIINELDKLNAL